MKRDKVLTTAEAYVMGDRQDDYGDASISFGRIAALWSAYLGREIMPYEVAAMMVLLKVSRSVESPGKADSWVDMAGYAALGSELTDMVDAAGYTMTDLAMGKQMDNRAFGPKGDNTPPG